MDPVVPSTVGYRSYAQCTAVLRRHVRAANRQEVPHRLALPCIQHTFYVDTHSAFSHTVTGPTYKVVDHHTASSSVRTLCSSSAFRAGLAASKFPLHHRCCSHSTAAHLECPWMNCFWPSCGDGGTAAHNTQLRWRSTDGKEHVACLCPCNKEAGRYKNTGVARERQREKPHWHKVCTCSTQTLLWS